MADTIEDALTAHLDLAEKLRGQLRSLQRTLTGPDDDAATLSPAEKSREQLLVLARGLTDAGSLRQLCELAAQLKQKETKETKGAGGAAAVAQPRPRLPSSPPPPPPVPPIEVTFRGDAKLGISFNSTNPADPPRILRIASDGAAAAFPQLKPGLLLRAIQEVKIEGIGFKAAMERLKTAARPLTLQFVESAYSFTMKMGMIHNENNSDSEEEYEAEDNSFTVVFAKDGPLGLSFGSKAGSKPPVTVTKVGVEAARSHARLRVGMVIVGVNGEDMRNKPLETVTGTIRSSGRPIELEFSTETENYAARSDDDEEDDDEDVEEGTPQEGAGVGLLPPTPAPAPASSGSSSIISVGGEMGKLGGEAPPLGEYKLLVNCRCYKEARLGSAAQEYSLDAEENFEVLETAVVNGGVIRLRSSDGWVNYLHAVSGQPILVPTGDLGGTTFDSTGDGADDDAVDHSGLTMVIFEKEGPLGITFGSDDHRGQPPVKISRINQGSLASQQPALRRGLVVVTIQGDSVTHMSLSEVICAIKAARRPLTLEFEKNSDQLDELSAIALLKQTKGSGQQQHRISIGMVDELPEGSG